MTNDMTDLPIPITLHQVNLVTPNLPATVEFYRLLGIDIPDTGTPWQPHHRTATFDAGLPDEGLDFDIDSTAFASYWGSEGIPTGPLLGFDVPSREDVDTLYQRITTAGHPGLREPYDTFWGARYAILQDPTGIAVGIMSPSNPTRRFPPPDPATFTADA